MVAVEVGVEPVGVCVPVVVVFVGVVVWLGGVDELVVGSDIGNFGRSGRGNEGSCWLVGKLIGKFGNVDGGLGKSIGGSGNCKGGKVGRLGRLGGLSGRICGNPVGNFTGESVGEGNDGNVGIIFDGSDGVGKVGVLVDPEPDTDPDREPPLELMD